MYSPNLESVGDSTLRGLAYELRPWQWYKQLILYIAVVFSGSAVKPNAWIEATAGAVLFCGIVGATYIVNDLQDIDEDRQHPRKRNRPIASGQLARSVAIVFALGLYCIAGVLSWYLNPAFFALVVLYVGQNLLYSYGIKQYVFVDLFVIASGFVIRAVAGVVLIAAEMSPWLVLCTFLAALMFGTSKRWGEYQALDNAMRTRETLGSYSEAILQFLFGSVATMLLMAYALYTFFESDLGMMLTIPFAFYAVFRYVHLTYVNDGASEPGSLLLDRPLALNFCFWGLVTALVLYGPSFGGLL